MGGIPLFEENLRNAAKLSILREITLPLFLLGATSISLSIRDLKGVQKHIFSFCIFLVGASIFTLNGKRLDVLVIIIVYILYFTRTSPPKRVLIFISSLLCFTLLLTIFYPYNVLMLVRQQFNFKVLRHLIFYIENPVTGAAHGAICLGLKKEFLGPHLIYGEKENWILTATWLGPFYMDFGFFGILISMISLAILLHLLQKKTNKLVDNQMFEVLYIVVLGRMLVLYEEGIDLISIIFLVAILYAISKVNLVNSSKIISREVNNKYKQKKNKGLITFTVLGLLGLVIISWTFNAEFRYSNVILQEELMTDQREMIFNSTMATRYYHFELLSSELAMSLHGILKISLKGFLVREFKIDGAFWLAKKDVVNIGWFKPPKEGQYIITLSGIDVSKGKIILRIKESLLSALMPTYRFLQLGVGIIFFSAVFGVFFICLAKK